jgi:hypothetical protein
VTSGIGPSLQNINYGATPAPITSPGGTGGNGVYTYVWQSSPNNSTWTTISGATTTSYAPGALTATVYYRLITTSNGDPVTSNTATVNVYPNLISGSISPSVQTINYNTSATALNLSGTAGGTGTYTYQWQSSANNSTWSNISSATAASYTPASLTATTYYRVITTSNGVAVTTGTATVDVYPQLVSGVISPNSQTLNYDIASATLACTAATGGNGSYTYQWRSAPDGATWTAISGATGTSFSPGAMTSTKYYDVIATSNGVSVTSATATVTVYPSLNAGTINPGSSSINYGATPPSMTLTGTTGGNGVYSYQWTASSVNISGATSTSYSPGAITISTNYSVTVISNGVKAYSNTVAITVYPLLVSGTIGPSSQSINYNTVPSALSISAASGGSGVYTYQWQSSPTGAAGSWSTITGATSTTYAPGSLTATTYYQVITTSNGASVASANALVNVYPAVVAGGISPSDQNINYNTAATTLTLSGTSGGNAYYYYQWQSAAQSAGPWTPISGATGTSYSPGTLTATAYYNVIVQSNGVSVTSGMAEVNVYPVPVSGLVTPATQTINYNTTASALTAGAPMGGSGVYSYQWQSAPDNSTWSAISGANSLSYSPGILTATTYYRLVTTSNGVSVNSNSVVVTVYPPLNPGTISAITTNIVYGTDAGQVTGTSATGGSGTYTYQWQSSLNGTTWTNISGSTAVNEYPGALDANVYFMRIATSNGVSANSNVVEFMVSASTNTPGKDSLAGGTATLTVMPADAGINNPENMNLIRVRSITKPGITDTVTADAITNAYQAHQSTEYFDGLGRNIEVVDKQNTPSQNDLIDVTFYDPFGRIAQKYLPYTDSLSIGTFRNNANTEQPAFYNSYFNNTENYYYSNTVFEPSPLDRPLQMTPPGNSWTGSSRGMSYFERSNNTGDSVRIWTITYGETDLPISTSAYAPGMLYVKQTTDEQGHTVIEYTDLDGHEILRKTQLTDNPTSGHAGWLCTYYVYDHLDHLRCVIPPLAVNAISTTGWNISSVANGLCFLYSYDYRGRMILKKLPGAVAEYMVYNWRDLPVLKQDGDLRSSNQWEVVTYDSLNRPVQTGMYSAPASYTLDQMQQNENTIAQPYPSGFTVNVQNYYDYYTGISVPAFSGSDVSSLISYPNSYPDPVTPNYQTRGEVTVSQKRVLEAPVTQWLTTVFYFDPKGRVIQSINNNISGGSDTTTTLYDFTGAVLSTYTRHNNKASTLNPRTTVLCGVNYDHMGRLIKTTKQLNNNGVNKTIDSLIYDPLGRVTQKNLGSQMESLNYAYNIRGWLRGINLPYLATSGTGGHYFGMELSYDYGFGTAAYNGNIAGMKWKSAGSDTTRAYGYLYDNVDRLLSAAYTQNSTGNGTSFGASGNVDFSVPQISYDANGNILTMNQRGLEGTSSNYIDQLTYGYATGSNQLQSVTDAAPTDSSYHLGDFQDGNTLGNDYTYDSVGNLKIDKNKGIDSIRYNYLNLPEYVHVKGKGNIDYVYDAGGVKQEKIVVDSTNGGKSDTTLYIGAFVYHRDTLQFMSHEEGRVRYFNYGEPGYRNGRQRAGIRLFYPGPPGRYPDGAD